MRFLLFFCIILCVNTRLISQNVCKYVNPLIGTSGTGHTFPGPSMPFGMVQPGPDNANFGWNHTSGYQYSDTFIMGFSQTRLSGTGINELGDILVLPMNSFNGAGKNTYYKETEKSSVGYYAVKKKDNIYVELTSSHHVAFHQYTYPNKEATICIDFRHGLRFIFEETDINTLVKASEIQLESSTVVSGYCTTHNWVDRTYYFRIEFSEPIVQSTQIESKINENAPTYLFDFHLNNTKKLKIKFSLSTVSVDGAKMNLSKEIDHWDFDRVVKENREAWKLYLSRITISANRKQKEIFYTGLYHLLLQPSNIADVDGTFRNANNQIMLAKNKEFYSTLSNWDIYRAAFPLLQIIAPERIDGIIQSMLLHHRDNGFLPIWTVWGKDNYCMIGNHAIPMIVSAYVNGFKGFDPNESLLSMVETSNRSHINSNWELYNHYGYYPFDSIKIESVSRTLESSFDDWCVSHMAKQLGQEELSLLFLKRSNYYKNLYDSISTFFRGKDTKGNWNEKFNPLLATSPLNNPGDYTEANAWQYFWTPAQFDIPGLMELLGGEQRFRRKLDSFFNISGSEVNKFLGQEAMIGQYAHGNEPSHHIMYLYSFTNNKKIGQKYIHQAVHNFYNNTVDGLIGNDDCGQLSAWYIFSTIGFYPVNSADGTFILGCPQVKKAVFHFENGREFKIQALNFSKKNLYSDEILLNQEKLKRNFIRFNEITGGGTLIFRMVPK